MIRGSKIADVSEHKEKGSDIRAIRAAVVIGQSPVMDIRSEPQMGDPFR